MNCLQAAIEYREKWAFSIVPCNEWKHPLVSWTQWQTELPSIDQIKEWWETYPSANVAIITGKLSNICAIDIDEPIGAEALNPYLPEALTMPIAYTPGGGQHLYFRPGDNLLQCNQKIIAGCDFKGNPGLLMAPPSEAYSDHDKAKPPIFGKYVWHVKLNDSPIPPLPLSYVSFIKSNILYINNSKNDAKDCNLLEDIDNQNKVSTSVYGSSTSVYTCLQVSTKKMFVQGTRDEDLFHIANCLVKGGARKEETAQTLEKLAISCDPPFSLKDAQIKVKSAIERAEKKNRNLAAEVREFLLSTSGYILSTDVYTCLQVSTREEKKNVSIILKRLANEGVLEKYGQKNGCYRLIDTSCEEIKWQDASTDTFSITLPMFLNTLVQIMPKNIIVVAGAPDAGKTAFLLNVAILNINTYKNKIHYFSSEMGGAELKKRLSGFEIGLSTWKNMKFYDRGSNFADIIRPDEVNIIDFLELNDEFWKVAKQLQDIHNKLKNGIAFVALQKDPKAKVGRGGTFGLEKPRLYLALDKKYPENVIRIIKAKNWAHEVNPNDMTKTFKIVKGCKLVETSEWKREER